MKMTLETYDTLKMVFRTTVDFAGGINKVFQHYKKQNLSNERMLWDIFWGSKRTLEKLAKDTNPNVEHTQHINTLNELNYKTGLNDENIETALKKIAKEINLI